MRGPVIDEQALYEALHTGQLAAAALGVLQHESPVENAVIDAYLRGELQNLPTSPEGPCLLDKGMNGDFLTCVVDLFSFNCT